jgi:adenylate cyclase
VSQAPQPIVLIRTVPAARLEGLTKDYDCALIVSRRAAQAAGLDLGERDLHECAVKGRSEPVWFYALNAVPDIGS